MGPQERNGADNVVGVQDGGGPGSMLGHAVRYGTVQYVQHVQYVKYAQVKRLYVLMLLFLLLAYLCICV